jgi:phosphate-selective porin OprO/OprP
MKNSLFAFLVFIQIFIMGANGSELVNVSGGKYEDMAVHTFDTLPVISNTTGDSTKLNKASMLSTEAPIQFSGYMHIRFQHFDQKGSYDGFDIHRVRLNLKGAITPKLNYKIQMEFAGKGAPKLIDAYGEWNIVSYFHITVGQFYIPLSQESLTPDNLQESIYRAQVVEALANRNKDITGDNNGRDIGAQISGSIIKLNNRFLIDYKLGIFNGAGTNVTADNNNFKDIAGRLVFHPLAGVDFGASVYHGSANYGTKPTNHLHNRQGCDLGVTYNNFNIKAEYLQGKDSSDVNRSGYYIQAGYFVIPKVFELLLKYDTYNPNLDVTNNYFSDYTVSAGYSFTSLSRIQLAYIYRREHDAQIKNNFAVVRFQLGF